MHMRVREYTQFALLEQMSLINHLYVCYFW